jgi:hypothetical protein
MNMIRQLPDTLVVTILLSWIELEDLGRLDAALCNRLERSNYITLVRRPIFVLRTSHGQCHSDEGNQRMDLIIMWLTKRQISSAELTVTTTFPDTRNSWLLYLRGHGTHVRKINIQGDPATEKVVNFEKLFRELCENCPHVEALHCQAGLSEACQELIALYWKHLTHLTTETLEMGTGLMAIAENCQSLVKIAFESHDLRHSLPVTFFNVCSPQLQIFKSNSVFLEPAHYHAIAARCPLLRELTSGGHVDDGALFAVGAGCQHLEFIRVPVLTSVTDAGLTAVARNGALTALWVGSQWVTDAGLRNVTSCCSWLMTVDITGCRQLTDTTLVALGQYSHNLRRLIVNCANMTHVGMEAVAAGCPLLEELTAFKCERITPALEATARSCCHLRCLRITPAVVLAEAVLALAECCPRLETLEGGAWTVCDAEITALVRGQR